MRVSVKKQTTLTLLFCQLEKEGRKVMARSARLESGFQDRLRGELKRRYPSCMIFKMDQLQGIPDMLVLIDDVWLSLENKRSKDAPRQPNQEYYVNKMNDMSFSRFVYPENFEGVLFEIEKYLESRGVNHEI